MLQGRIILALIAASGLSVPKVQAQQCITASECVVVSEHPAATEVGLGVLRSGGNAIDAAVATSLAMGVAAPYGSGLGGKLVMLYHEAATGKVHCIEANCAAPDKIEAESFADLRLRDQRFGFHSACVPGMPAGLWMAHQKWGSASWKSLVDPAAKLAEVGVQISAKMQSMIAPEAARLRRDAEAARLYLVDGQVPPVGTMMKNADLAATLRLLANHGSDGFYKGHTAERIVAAAAEHGSPMSLEDLASYQPTECEPLSVSYRGHRVYSSPPPQIGGAIVLMALKALEKASWEGVEPRDAKYMDTIGRVMLCVYPRVESQVADTPAAAEHAVALLKSAGDVLQESEGVDPADPASVARLGHTDGATLDDLPDASTSHLIIADRQGNVVSLTQSLSFHFGASVVVPGTGILLNNSMSNFAVGSAESVNRIESGKRPRSTIAPVIVTKGQHVKMALGIPGGQRIPTTTIQLMVDVLDFQVPMAQAFAAARFHVRRPLSASDSGNLLDFEGEPSDEIAQLLTSEGWQVVSQRADGRYFGGGSAVVYDDQGIVAVADERRTNQAAGY